MICFSKMIISYLPDIFKAFQNELTIQTAKSEGSVLFNQQEKGKSSLSFYLPIQQLQFLFPNL